MGDQASCAGCGGLFTQHGWRLHIRSCPLYQFGRHIYCSAKPNCGCSAWFASQHAMDTGHALLLVSATGDSEVCPSSSSSSSNMKSAGAAPAPLGSTSSVSSSSSSSSSGGGGGGGGGGNEEFGNMIPYDDIDDEDSNGIGIGGSPGSADDSDGMGMVVSPEQGNTRRQPYDATAMIDMAKAAKESKRKSAGAFNSADMGETARLLLQSQYKLSGKCMDAIHQIYTRCPQLMEGCGIKAATQALAAQSEYHPITEEAYLTVHIRGRGAVAARDQKIPIRYRNLRWILLELLMEARSRPTSGFEFAENLDSSGRRWCKEMWNGEWWRRSEKKMRDELAPEEDPRMHHLIPVIFQSDAAIMDKRRGKYKAHPLEVTLGNFPLAERTKQDPAVKATVVQFPETLPLTQAEKASLVAEHQSGSDSSPMTKMHHDALRLVLQPLRELQRAGGMLYSWKGRTFTAHFVVSLIIGDGPQRDDDTCHRQGTHESAASPCPNCNVGSGQRNNPFVRYQLRHGQSHRDFAMAKIDTVEAGVQGTVGPAKADMKQAGLRLQRCALWDLDFGDNQGGAYGSVWPEKIHQALLGVDRWLLDEILEGDQILSCSALELDSRATKLIPHLVRQSWRYFHGSFPKGISKLTQLTAEEVGALMFVLIFTIGVDDGAISSEIERQRTVQCLWRCVCMVEFLRATELPFDLIPTLHQEILLTTLSLVDIICSSRLRRGASTLDRCVVFHQASHYAHAIREVRSLGGNRHFGGNLNHSVLFLSLTRRIALPPPPHKCCFAPLLSVWSCPSLLQRGYGKGSQRHAEACCSHTTAA